MAYTDSLLSRYMPGSGLARAAAEADRELEAYVAQVEHQNREELRKATESTLRLSIEREERDRLAEEQKTIARARNISPFDYNTILNEAALADSRPTGVGMGLTYTTLRRMASVPVIANILDTRLVQLQPFFQRQRHRNREGYRVVMRDFNQAPSRAALKEMSRIEAWYETCGDPTQQRDPSFPTVMTMMARDSLTYDQMSGEILLDKDDKPAALLPVDAKTMRLAHVTDAEFNSLRRDIKVGRYVQVLADGKRYGPWTDKDMLFAVRRPRTDMDVNGYGFPELEQLAGAITNLIRADLYNSANFTNGVNAAGMLVVNSAMDLESFKYLDQNIRQSLTGAQNAHRLAVMQMRPAMGGLPAESVDYKQFGNNNKDMEFSAWISWLLKLCCAAYQMDPAEINYVYGNEGQRSALGNQDPTERIATSRERGLSPLLKLLSNTLNNRITYRLDPDFKLEFFGLERRAPLVESQLKVQSMGWRSINAIRAEDDEPRIDHWSCDVPANPLILNIISKERDQAKQEAQAAAQAQAQQAAGGAPGGPAGPGGAPAPAPQGPTDNSAASAPATMAFSATDLNLPEDLPPEVLTAVAKHRMLNGAQPAPAPAAPAQPDVSEDDGVDFEATDDPDRHVLPEAAHKQWAGEHDDEFGKSLDYVLNRYGIAPGIREAVVKDPRLVGGPDAQV